MIQYFIKYVKVESTLAKYNIELKIALNYIHSNQNSRKWRPKKVSAIIVVRIIALKVCVLTRCVAEGQGVDDRLPLDGEEQAAPIRTPAAGLPGGGANTWLGHTPHR